MTDPLPSNSRVSGIAINMRRWLELTEHRPLDEYRLDRDAVAQILASIVPEPSVNGVKCVHCNGTGEETQYYDEETGWSEAKPCTTCNGSGRITTVDQYLKTVKANWHEDSSLETWFPITAMELARLQRIEQSSQPPRLWQPIQTIPRGEWVLLDCGNAGIIEGVYSTHENGLLGYWDSYGSVIHNPLHWITCDALPEPPCSGTTKAGEQL